MTTQGNDTGLFGPLFHGPAIGAVFTDRAHLQGMLDFEAALARAEAKTGVIPADAAGPIAAQCDAALYDLAAIAEGATRGGNTAIPLIKALTARVAAKDKSAAGFVHWGATSQDAMDTGLVLQLHAAVALIEADLAKLSANLAALAQKHRQTPMVGRTWLQHALPITFGLKVAGWLDAVERHRARIVELKPRLLVLQFGGAAGTLAALGDKGLVVAEALAADLKLGLPATPWHGARDRVVEFGTALALLTGTLGKMARDIALLMQTDVAEAFEPAGEGKGGSSTMPHKRNPVVAAAVLAAATRVPHLAGSLLSGMVQEHERGLGGWHAEWQALPELAQLSAGALAQMVEVITGLEVKPEQMRANLDATHGLIMAEAVAMALGAKLGKQEAHHLVEAASKRAVAEKRHLRDVLAQERAVLQHLDNAVLEKLFDPLGYTGVATALIDRVLAARRP
ncbi:3-carboxy-cis,cis-muconate cycloisomerase [Ferrovibrio sp.]|uniref:3-carboxy-cis,cis-muconate cycloisomerase n=1 Tax=Ferrovibrio sp. TaxID=1917215 RepID=UPI000CB704BF|nr:3-carboxy-cis,cis-muconate cycloisomerase [Ferrovibrio sp.]PJI39099.1 MAG: 3-carboxy-cis,cis-muconate cycloisomerase [Ferrovibrio sp.]